MKPLSRISTVDSRYSIGNVGFALWGALVISAMSLPTCVMAQPVEKAATVIFPEQAALIPAQEIPKLQKEALQGSSEAAHRLATYYETIKLQLDEAIYWNQIRVENGDTDARYDLGACLIAMSDPASRIRGRYWLMQLQSNGPPKLVKAAGSMLESLDEKEKYEKMNKH